MENLHYGFNYSKKKKSMCEEYSQFSFLLCFPPNYHIIITTTKG